ncbi:hypothetical protein sos41_32220 [Alphaproteobacteria bacterium SO-S41]|nr:hypothetical protein sos41_32220 [Alphaproteobacteria bacterium SO-S41]
MGSAVSEEQDGLGAAVPPEGSVQQQVIVSEYRWTVRRGFKGGAVLFEGMPAFAAAFMPAEDAGAEDFSQDEGALTLHDSETGLIFRDFQWEDPMPEDPEVLARLMLRMMRVVAAIVKTRAGQR